MIAPLRIREAQVYPLTIPMRTRFEHAAASRNTADPIVLRLSAEAPYVEQHGFGETLARVYVTGETVESVIDDLTQLFVPQLLDFHPTSFPEALEFIDELPNFIDGRLVNAAGAAVSSALLDLSSRIFGRSLSEVSNWLGLRGFGAARDIRPYSGIVIGRGARLGWFLWAQRRYGLRDFKIKAAVDGWESKLEAAYRVLRRDIAAGRATLRADANGAWTLPQALDALPLLERCGVSALEQPLPPDRDEELSELARRTRIELIADESLRTLEDAERLIEVGAVRIFNVRIAKCGGLLPSLKIADAARKGDREVQLGCLVGETSLLSAVGAEFLSQTPDVRFVEGAFGRWLLRDDVTDQPLTFGYGGSLKRRRGFGWRVNVSMKRLERLSAATRPMRL